jgi:hypothetical protein
VLLFGIGTKGPSIMGFEDEAEQSFGRPCRQSNGRNQADIRTHLIHRPARDIGGTSVLKLCVQPAGKDVDRATIGIEGSASPSPGRPVGSRSKLGDAFVESLQRKWQAEGDDIINRVARDNPEKILEVMARVLPKELAISVEQRTPGGLDADSYAALRRLLDLIERLKIEGEPQAVFERIEASLRADSATVIEQK